MGERPSPSNWYGTTRAQALNHKPQLKHLKSLSETAITLRNAIDDSTIREKGVTFLGSEKPQKLKWKNQHSIDSSKSYDSPSTLPRRKEKQGKTNWNPAATSKAHQPLDSIWEKAAQKLYLQERRRGNSIKREKKMFATADAWFYNSN